MSTLGKQVEQHILEQIKAGKLKVGDRLPPEVSIATDLGVSRSTVRLAFAELEKGGVLSRRKRAGTQIIAEKPQQRFSMATRNVQELLSLGRETHLQITGIASVRTETIPELHDHHLASDIWLEISGTRVLHDESLPFSINRVYVPSEFSDIKPLLTSDVTSVFQLIEKTYNLSVARVIQTTRAITCPPEERATMGLGKAAPALRIEASLYTSSEKLIEVSVATFDPERFQLHTEVKIV